MIGRDEFNFANDVRAAMEERAPSGAWVLIGVIGAILTVGVIWAQIATLEEVTSGDGRVIPSSQLQMVQTLEGGIVREILLREGDTVEKGQVLMRIDDTGFASRLGELDQRRWALRAEMVRLRAEASGAETVIEDPELLAGAPELQASAQQVFEIRRRKRDGEASILRQQLVQKQQELLELEARKTKLVTTKKPLDRELALTRRMKERGVVPEIEVLRMERQAAEIDGELAIVEASLPRASSAIEEAGNRIESAQFSLQAEARERLVKLTAELAVIEESIKAAKDRVTRAALKAPVRGIVNKLNVNTIGAVLKPGQDIIEIVPLGDTLLIEARLRPQDVAFIRPDQAASVKLTAYDYSIYGALEGKVERISADTITDDKAETFYRVIVRTRRTHLEIGSDKLPIIPGMVAQVDILTGKKTVLDYLLKPLTKVRHEALRER